MNVTIEDRATPEIRGYIARLSDRSQLHNEMGMAVERQTLRHLRRVKKPQGNRLRAPSTGFWKKAINSVVARADAKSATVSIPARGVALQYYGGTVRAKTKPWLTIPIHARAHGKSVEEVGARVYRFLSKKGNLILATDPAPPRGGGGGRERKPRSGPPRYRGGTPLYVLKKSVRLRPRADVLPPEAEMAETAARAAERYIRRIRR